LNKEKDDGLLSYFAATTALSRIIKCLARPRPRETERTYNPPKPKTSINPCFCFAGRFKVFSTGIGRMMMAISEIMLNEALENQNAIMLIQ
jgi:hypothetical protein